MPVIAVDWEKHWMLWVFKEERRMSMKEHEYIRQTLERYTNSKLEDFCDHVLITNFRQYIKGFQEKTNGKAAQGFVARRTE
jgi:hypothetical protein